jgi:hypothetical protein
MMSSAVDQLLSFVARYDGNFATRVRGARAQDVAALGRLVGRPLPPAYAAYLARMGENDAALTWAFDASTTIAAVTAYYRERAAGTARVADGCILIACDGVQVPEVSLQGQQRQPRVVFTCSGTVRGVFAESFEKLLLRSAFRRYWPLGHACSRFYSAPWEELGRQPVLPRAQDIVARAGFRPLWFSDTIAYCGQRPGAAAFLQQYENQGLTVKLAGDVEAELDELGRSLAAQLPIAKRYEG